MEHTAGGHGVVSRESELVPVHARAKKALSSLSHNTSWFDSLPC